MKTKRPGKKIDKHYVSTESRKLIVDIYLDAKRSLFLAEVDGVSYQNGDLNKLKEDLSKKLFELDRQVFYPYIEYDIPKDPFWPQRTNGYEDGARITIQMRPVFLTQPATDGTRLYRVAWFDDDPIGGGKAGLRWHENDRGHRYNPQGSLVEYTDARYLALLEIVKAINGMHTKLEEMLRTPDTKTIESTLDNMSIGLLLGTAEKP